MDIPRARRVDPDDDNGGSRPRRYRRDHDRDHDDDRDQPRPTRRRTGMWWWVLLAAVILILVVIASIAIFIATYKPVPTAPTARTYYPGYRPPATTNLTEVTAEEKAAVRALMAKFGTVTADRKEAVEELFDNTELEAVRVDGMTDEWATGPHGLPVVAGDLLRGRRTAVWEKWDGKKADIRQIKRRAYGQGLEVIVWHQTKTGKREKVRWTMRLTSSSLDSSRR